MKYLKMSAFVLLYLSVYLVLQVYLTSVIGMFYAIFKVIQDPFINPATLTEPLLRGTVYILIISGLIAFLIYWFVFWLRKINMFRFCRFTGINPKSVALVCVLGIAMVVPVSFLVEYFKIDQLSKSTGKMFEMLFESNNALVLLLGVGIIGPMIEEIIFRGLILNELRRNMKLPIAIIIQAFLFGIYHFNLTQGIYAFALGLLFGLVLAWTNSIWSTILIHIFFNSSSVIFSKLPTGEPEFLSNTAFLIISSVIAIITIMLIMKNRKRELA